MTTVFVCNSAYQVLISAIMCATEYASSENYLAMDAYFYHTIQGHYQIDGNPFFIDTICLNDDTLDKDVDQVISLLPDKVHLFNWGNPCSRLIYEKATCPIEITDEGIGSYQLQKMWLHRGVSFSKVSCIWLLVPELSQDTILNIPIKKLPVEALFSCESQRIWFLEQINRLFRYIPSHIPDVIYFDRYFVSGNMMPTSTERAMLAQLIPLLQPYDYCVKLHPSENVQIAKYRYRDLPAPFFVETRVPWEVALLNLSKKQRLVLISVNSTPIVLSKMLSLVFDIQIESICLIDIVKEYVNLEELFISPLVDAFNCQFPQDPIIRVSTFPALHTVLARTLDTNDKVNIKVPSSETVFTDVDWLRNEYLWYSRAFGNLLDTVKLSIQIAGQEHAFYDSDTFYSWRDERVEALFDLDLKNTKPIQGAWKLNFHLASRNVLQSVENLEISCINQQEKQTVLYKSRSSKTELELLVETFPAKVIVKFSIPYPIIDYNYREYI